MDDNILKHLHDIKESALSIRRFIKGKSFADYERDELLQSGVERKFEIIGEALNRIKKDYQKVLEDIREYRNIISFRNILIHGYNGISHRIVWGVIEEDIDNIIEDIDKLLEKGD